MHINVGSRMRGGAHEAYFFIFSFLWVVSWGGLSEPHSFARSDPLFFSKTWQSSLRSREVVIDYTMLDPER